MSIDVAEARRAAVERLQERRNVWESHTEAEQRRAWVDGRALPRMDIFAPEVRPGQTLGEWLDDRVLERTALAGFPETQVLTGILEAARQGQGDAVKAVKAARQLDRGVQAVAYRNVLAWKGHADAPKVGAEALMNAVLTEWERLGLATEDPDGD